MKNRKAALLYAVVFLLFSVFNSTIQAQEVWSLRKCIEYARENSLTLKQAQYGIEMARLTDRQNRMARLPTFSGSASGGFQFGRTIDPATNTFDNQQISFNSFGINGGATLYSGGRISNTIKQGEVNLQAAQEDAAAAFNDIALSIANVYLQILMSEEQLVNASNRLQLSLEQLDYTDKLIQAGSLPANDRLDVLAQIANDEQSIVQAHNSIDINYVNLMGLLQLDPGVEINIEKPQIVIPADVNPEEMNFGDVYSIAVNTQPDIKAAQLRMESAEYGVDLARSGMLPTLSVFGGIDSRWSSVSKIIDQISTDYVTQTIRINGMDVEVQFPSQNATFKNNPYFDQLNQNFGQSVGLSLQVPIYSNSRNRINMEMAQVNILNSRVQSDQARQQLKNNVQQAIANARAGRRTLDSAEKALEASKSAFENAEKRFRLGAINNLQLNTARNTFDIAETNLTVAKYDYLFRLKILDFYLGKEITLDGGF